MSITEFNPENCKITLNVVFDNAIIGEIQISYGPTNIASDSTQFLKELATSNNMYEFKVKILEYLNTLSEKGHLKVVYEGITQT